MDMIVLMAKRIGTGAAQFARTRIGLGDQVDGYVMFKDLQILLLCALQQGAVNRLAGGISAVDDTTMAVSAFLSEMIILFAAFLGEADPLIDQPLDRAFAALHGKTYGVFMAQARTGYQGVRYVRIDRILIIQHRRNPPLSEPGRAFIGCALAQQGYFGMSGEV